MPQQTYVQQTVKNFNFWLDFSLNKWDKNTRFCIFYKNHPQVKEKQTPSTNMSKSKLLLSTLVAAAATISAASAFAGTVSTYTEAYQRGEHAAGKDDPWSFTALDFSSFAGESNVVLSSDGTSDGTAIDVSANNIYFNLQSGETVTITSANINADDVTRSTYNNVSTYYAFIVEGGNVVFSGSGVKIEELGLNFSVGTMTSATLTVTNNAKVVTTAYNSVIGSNGATGTIAVSDGGELYMQQVTLGLATASLASDVNSLGATGYYDTRYLQSDADYNNHKAGNPWGSGVIEVTNGGKVYIGTGETSANPYQTKLQFSNGTISVDGKGSALYVGSSSYFVMGSEVLFEDSDGNPVAGLSNFSQTISVSGGGVFTNEMNGDTQTKLDAIEIGANTYASDSESKVEVTGSESKFDLAVGSIGAYIGYSAGGYQTGSNVWVPLEGGKVAVSISATDSGTFAVTSAGGIYVAQEDGAVFNDGTKLSYGLTVDMKASDGGQISLVSTDESVYLATGESTADSDGNTTTNTVSVTSTGSGSLVEISGQSVYANTLNDSNVAVNLAVNDGATMKVSATGATGEIQLNQKTTITVGNNGKLETSGTVNLNSGSTLSISDAGVWSGDTINVNDGAALSINIAAVADGDNDAAISAGTVVISTSADVSVVVDVSALKSLDLEEGAEFTVNLIEYTQGALTGTISDDAVSVSGDSQANWDVVSVSATGTMLTAVLKYVPEPSMFGLVAGIAALGLVATARRRRHGRKA